VLRTLRPIAFSSLAMCFSSYITQKFSDLPFSEKPDVSIPDEAFEVLSVVFYCLGAFSLGLFSKDESLHQGLEGCPR